MLHNLLRLTCVIKLNAKVRNNISSALNLKNVLVLFKNNTNQFEVGVVVFLLFVRKVNYFLLARPCRIPYFQCNNTQKIVTFKVKVSQFFYFFSFFVCNGNLSRENGCLRKTSAKSKSGKHNEKWYNLHGF